MATLNYTQRLNNLQARKYNKELNESALSNSFERFDIPANVKYMYEAMRAIDEKYNTRTIEAANRVQKHLEDGFRLHFGRDYRTQGSVKTSTNIKVHSDFDLLTIIAKYFYLHPEVTNDYPYKDSDPKLDIEELREQATAILKRQYDDVDTQARKVFLFGIKPLIEKSTLFSRIGMTQVSFEGQELSTTEECNSSTSAPSKESRIILLHT